MSLAPGGRLGPYEIVALLGSGGMGEVYKARDTRLGRTVAIKVLSTGRASNDTLRARFEREAHAISALQHPNICTLLDVGEENGEAFLVMEHLAGETLAQRLATGPLPLAQALDIATQIAEALAAAHKQGIVHRDLKPSNVMLTKTGVKLLDFGLARLTQNGKRSVVDELNSAPTEPTPLTGKGTILGTLPYMAPEQLEGKRADGRTDLWALGAIVYEMVSGRRAFEGSSQVNLIAAIVEREPVALSSVRPITPPSLERLVRRCLAKSPDDRWDGAHDVADELRWIAQAASGPAATGTGPAARRGRWGLVVGLLALAAGAVVGGLAVRRFLAPAGAQPFVVRALIDVRPAEQLSWGSATDAGARTAMAWSPDGRSLVFVGRQGGVQQLYVRALDSTAARPLAGTEGAEVPVVSPDGGWVAFWADGAIRRVPLAGGPVSVLVAGLVRSAHLPFGMTWGGDGRLFYAEGVPPDSAIWSVEAEGAPAALTKARDGEVRLSCPHMLPDGHALLYTARHRIWTWGDEEVVAHVFATRERKVLLKDAADARYVASGHLVFLRRGTLFAVAFDLPRLAVRGTPVPVLDGVAQALTSGNGADLTGAGQFSVSPTGTLAYVGGPAVPNPVPRLVAVDREGRVSPLDAPTRSYSLTLDLSPDGRFLAVPIRSLTEQALWLYDRERSTLGKLTAGGEALFPRWAPDGQHVAFQWLSQGVYQLAWQRADGTAGPEILARDAGPLRPSSWSPDGRHLTFTKDNGIWIATIENGKAAIERLTRTPDIERWPEFSPDGRWLAYGSNASGQDEVYVQPYPGPGPRRQVSVGGGQAPAWSPTGHELFFVSSTDSDEGQVMVVDVRLDPTLTFGKPRRLFGFSQSALDFAGGPSRLFAVAPDGGRFYVGQEVPAPPRPPVKYIELIQNWTEELKARVAAGTGR